MNIASRVQQLADAGEIYVSEEVYLYPGVREAVAHCRIEHEHVAMKGISQNFRCIKYRHKSDGPDCSKLPERGLGIMGGQR